MKKFLRAAALLCLTALLLCGCGAGPELLDRPFIFIIMSPSGQPLLAGTVNNI